MDIATDSPLFAALRDSGRVSAEHLSAAEEAFRACGNDPGRLADQLSELGCVTKYQHRKIQLGRAADLIFGPYLILERIGEGGMGKVYRAIQMRLGRMVAIKTIRPNLLTNKVVVSRYRREARAAAALDHPNIVKLFEADDVDGRYYLAMEMVEGMDLSRLTKELQKDKRAIVPAEAAEYIRQAALGLQHAHDKGLVHRDIKPSNLLVSGERAIPGTGGLAAVKILDMGLVRSLSEEDSTQVDLTRDGTVVGTPDYMAPEQAKNSSTVDHRADIYALGCTLFFALRGAPPYSDGTAIDKLIRHQLDPIPDIRQYRPDVPAGLAAVIRRMMAKKADERQQTGGEVARELAPYTEEAVRFDLVAPKFESVEFTAPAEPKSAEVETAVVAAPPAPTVTRTVRPLSGPTVQRTVRAVAQPTSGQVPPPGTRLPQSVRTKPISKPTGDVTPSDSLPGDGGRADPPILSTDTPPAGLRTRKTGRRPAYSSRRPSKKAFPLVPVAAVVGVLLAAAFVVAAVLLSRGGTPTLPTKAASDPDKPPPAPVVAFRPIADLIPDDTAAVLVANPKQYWEVAHTEVRPLGHVRPNATLLTTAFKFNPWKCDRVVVALQPNPARCVAAGEGELLARPDQFRKDLEQLKRFSVETTKEGITLVRQGAGAKNPFNADKRLRGAVLPAPAAYLIGTDGVELADTVRTAGTREQKKGVDPKLLAAVAADTSVPRPFLRFVASGGFELPPKKDAGREPLSKHGVELLTLVVRLEAKRFHLELTLAGSNPDRLREFVTTFLPALLLGHVPTADGKALAEAVRDSAAAAVLTADGDGHKLTARFAWDWQTAHDAAEKIIPLPPLLPGLDK